MRIEEHMKIHLPACLPVLLIAASTAFVAVPARAEVDLSGSWAGIAMGDDALLPADFTGIPYNEAGREKGLGYSQSQISMPERVCSFYTQTQLFGGPFGLKILKQAGNDGKTAAWVLAGWEDRAPMTIWVDGRPRASASAPHDKSGFTTGYWDGDTLVSYTTHMKTGFIRRNGAPHSDQATMTIHYLLHGDMLTLAAMLEDPVYLSEPLYWSRTFRRTQGEVVLLDGPCVQGYEGVEEGVVPHYLPGKNPFMDEMAKAYHIPVYASQGGAETMYPEFRKKMKADFVIIEKCTRNCGGGRGGPPGAGGPGGGPPGGAPAGAGPGGRGGPPGGGPARGGPPAQ
jgi:hypothetical protein